MKIAYVGSGSGVKTLLRLIEDNHIIHSIYCPNRSIEGFISAIKNTCVTLPEFNKKKLDKNDLDRLERSGVECLVVNGYSWKIPTLPESIIGINIHPTLLPEGRGPDPFSWTILNDLKFTGITSHKLTDDFDMGDILHQTIYEVFQNDTQDSLIEKFYKLAPDHVSYTLKNIRILLKNSLKQGAGSYWPHTTEQDQTIDWSWRVDTITKMIRAFNLDGANAVVAGKKVRIFSANKSYRPGRGRPGTVISDEESNIEVAALDGFINLTKVEYI